MEGGETYTSLQSTNEQSIKDFPRFIAVSDILKGFCCVLTADVEEDFFSTSVK